MGMQVPWRKRNRLIGGTWFGASNRKNLLADDGIAIDVEKSVRLGRGEQRNLPRNIAAVILVIERLHHKQKAEVLIATPVDLAGE